MATSIYKVTLKSDGGRTVTWQGAASSREAAINAATKAENAPARSVISVGRRNISGSTNDVRKKRFEIRFKSDKTGNKLVTAYVMAQSQGQAETMVEEKHPGATIEEIKVSKGPKKAAYRS